jgi:polygalacturonase
MNTPSIRGRSFLSAILFTLAAVAGTSAAQPSKTGAIQVNVKQSGAIGDGAADDTAAIQSALNGGQRTVIIPAGTYKISNTLKLDSGTTIQADARAIIRLADHADNDVGLFVLANRDFTAGNIDITVDGGIWDGNNEHNARGRPEQMPCYTGAALNFINVRRLTLRNLTVRNPDAYAIRACHLGDFVIEKIGFDFSVTRPNQDGVHLDGFCERGVIRNLRALSPYATNDDMVALNADDGSAKDYVIQQGNGARTHPRHHGRAPPRGQRVHVCATAEPSGVDRKYHHQRCGGRLPLLRDQHGSLALPGRRREYSQRHPARLQRPENA